MKSLVLFLFSFCITALVCNIALARQSAVLKSNWKELNSSHDITAPSWGPYSKKYAGISHITDRNNGIRFDFTVAAGFYRGKMVVPNHLFESGFHPWHASSDLNSFSFREEIVWKDKVYADISFSRLTDESRLIKIELVNSTTETQSLALNMLAGLVFPEVRPIKVSLPSGGRWFSGIDYAELNYAVPRFDDHLRPDGLKKGERRSSLFTNGSALADDFGKNAGDNVRYEFKSSLYKNAALEIRYKVATGKTAVVKCKGLSKDTIHLAGTGRMETHIVPIGNFNSELQSLGFETMTAIPIELDGFALVDESQIADLRFEPVAADYEPLTESVGNKKNVVLKYPGVKNYYGLAWQGNADFIIRKIYADELDITLRKVAGDNIYTNASARTDGFFTNIFLRTVEVAPRSKQTIFALLCQGSKNEVTDFINDFSARDTSSFSQENVVLEASVINPEGKPYHFSQKRMQAAMLQNVVFPIYNSGSYTSHFTPGKRWNSLYTWDSGFIGLGMTEIDINRAVESLNTYTTNSRDPNAFIQHGSLVPVQFFLYQDLWNRTQSKELLSYFYPRLKKYYLFYTGQWGNSSTNKLKSGLLNSFDYFYNSGGWDDYPAQEFLHKNNLTGRTAPVITTAMAIRIARILSAAAQINGYETDLSQYTADINRFTKAIQDHAWDEKSGYFGYVLHDSISKQPVGILKTAAAENYNKGLDGIYPLIAGICTPAQKTAVLKNLFTTGRLWSAIGISAVDQSSAYFSKEGYWNGAVWFPHQWFIWKTMLDIGESSYAGLIAQTALNLYKQETDSTYNTYEIFRLQTGHGNAWHQFSGLSAPVMNWFGAYYRPGTLTCGFNGWVVSKTYSSLAGTLEARIKFVNADGRQAIIACMPSGKKYKVFVEGKPARYTEEVSGALAISINEKSSREVKISIHP